MYVAVLFHRKTRQEDRVGHFIIPKNKEIIVCSYNQHMNDKLWNADEAADGSRPASEFWGERFLSYSNTPSPNNPSSRPMEDPGPPTPHRHCYILDRKPKLQMASLWNGERLCPGRHFANLKVILTYAILSSAFDIELMTHDGRRPEPDMRHFGYGTLPPREPIPFRIRRKVVCFE
jgi:cytochrome P450